MNGMSFESSVIPPQSYEGPAFWCIFRNDHILIHQLEECAHLPQFTDPAEFNLEPLRTQYLGTLNGIPCYASEVTEHQVQDFGAEWSFQGLRQLFYALPEEMFALAGRAFQIIDWDRTHQYCGRCGHPTKQLAEERAKTCPQCHLTQYTRISPAIIVAIVKDDQLLLAHAPRFPNDLYSVVAGFVEPGETFEDCVRREVKEEVGIDVSDIRYFGSQPWPFPNSLMVGFTAKYAGGEICVDQNEITDAGWFRADNFPKLPGTYSIARRLIDWFVEQTT